MRTLNKLLCRQMQKEKEENYKVGPGKREIKVVKTKIMSAFA